MGPPAIEPRKIRDTHDGAQEQDAAKNVSTVGKDQIDDHITTEIAADDKIPINGILSKTSSSDILFLGAAPIIVVSVLLVAFFVSRLIQQMLNSNDLGLNMRQNDPK